MLVAPALLLGAVLIASGALKWRAPASLEEFEQLGVPKVLHRQWIARLHPWGEFALGLILMTTGGWVGLLAATIGAALMGTYLALVIRARASTADASCACFGSTKRITAVTIARNVWLMLLGAAAVGTSWRLPLIGGPLAAMQADTWATVLFGVAAALTVALVMWPDTKKDDVPAEAVRPASDDELDYVRSITPAIPVTLADGSTQTLRELSQQRPLLMLAVSATCGACTSTIESRHAWRELLPEVDIRLIVTVAPEDTPITETGPMMSMHDAQQLVGVSLGYASTPSAVLFGVDGMLAGGPVRGGATIQEFVDDIYESLHGERPAR